MMCGGLNGCPTSTRSGCLHFDCMTLGVIPEELDAMIESTGRVASMSANSFILNSGRSGAFSWTRSACASAAVMSGVKVRRSRAAPGERPMASSCPHASSTYLRRLASALGAGSHGAERDMNAIEDFVPVRHRLRAKDLVPVGQNSPQREK